MTSNQVGFAIQADVIGGASLVHAATGRLLKALSDGGVDFYAVAAAVQLGKNISIDASQEVYVNRLVAAKRGSRSSFLSKALKIGWGHSDVAVELCRTRAGTVAMLFIGALATGSNSFTAASAISELMVLYGAQADQLPSIDSLRAAVEYLSQFTSDSNLRYVLEHITTTTIHHYLGLKITPSPALTSTGNVRIWAALVKQLVDTAEREETAHLQIEQQGAWLSAFAANILNMSVVLMDGDRVLWEAAGLRGKVVFNFGTASARSLRLRSDLGISIEPGPYEPSQGVQREIAINYAVSDAFESVYKSLYSVAPSGEVVRVPEQFKLVTKIATVFESIALLGDSYENPRTQQRLTETLSDVGFSDIPPLETLEVLEKPSFDYNSVPDMARTAELGYPYRSRTVNAKLSEVFAFCQNEGFRCTRLRGSLDPSKHCICWVLYGLIKGISHMICALMYCNYDLGTIRVDSGFIKSISRPDRWSDSLSTFDREHLFNILKALFLPDMSQNVGESVLAISNGGTSIFYTGLFEEQAFDEQNRIISIKSGQIFYNGDARKVVRDVTIRGTPILRESFQLTTGLHIAPQYAPAQVRIFMSPSLGEDHIMLSFKLKAGDSADSPSTFFSLSACYRNFDHFSVAAPCGHSKATPFVLRAGESAELRTFASLPFSRKSRPQKSPMPDIAPSFIQVAGSSLEQLIHYKIYLRHCVDYGDKPPIIQGDSCLRCLYDSGYSCIIMS